MRTRRQSFVPVETSSIRWFRKKDGTSGYFSRTQAWTSAILAPVVFIGLATVGFALPANADTGSPGASTTQQASTPGGSGSQDATTSDSTTGSSDAGAGSSGQGGTDTSSTGDQGSGAGASGASGATSSGQGSGGTGAATSETTSKSSGSTSDNSTPAGPPSTGTLILKADVSGTATQANWIPQTTSGSDAPVNHDWDTAITLGAGSYTLSEVDSTTPPPAGYTLTGLTCDPAGDPATSVADPTVTIVAGQDVTCTFTNTAPTASKKSNSGLVQAFDAQPNAVACTTIGGFEIDGNMVENTCGGSDWNTPGLDIGSSTDVGTYSVVKDNSDPSGWTSGGGTPPKVDFQQVYSYAQVLNGNYYVYAAWERSQTSGTGGYAIEIDNAGVRTGNGVPQPDRSAGGFVFYITTQGSDAPVLGQSCVFTSQADYPGDCSSGTSGYAGAVNAEAFTDPLNGSAMQPGQFLEVGLNVTELTDVAPGCPASNVASLYMRSFTGQNSGPTGNLKGFIGGEPVAPPTDCPTITVNKGGVRNSNGDVDPLAGATFTAYAGSYQSAPSGPPVGTCTTDADGTCTMTVTTDSDDGYWVVETSAPDGWSVVGSLGTGNYNNAKNVTAYQYHVGSDGGTLPRDADAPRQGRQVMAHSDQWANVANNPPFPQKCGLNIAMVFDTSSSISRDEMDQFKEAATDFVGDGGLGGTPSTVSMYRFSTTASTLATDINLSTASGVQDAIDTIDSLPSSGNGYTNWDDGFRQVAADGNFDLVLFMTDGDPTTYGSGNDTNLDVPFKTIEQGIFSANEVKSQTGPGGEHTKIVGVGVGMSANSYLNLAAITGPNQGDDYFLASDFGDLKQKLQDIATKNCGGTLTVVKKTEKADGTVIDESASGWTFTATGTVVDGSPKTQTTTDTGTNFALTFPGDSGAPVTVTETQQDGYELHQQDGLNASCNVDGVTNDGDLGFTVPTSPNSIVTCTVVNRQVAQTHVVVKKELSPTDDPGRFDLSMNGTVVKSDAGNGDASDPQLVDVDDQVTVSEAAHTGSNLADYTSTLTCDQGVTVDPNTGTSGQFTVPDSARGKTITCTFTNTRIQTTITLQKAWVNGVNGDVARYNINGDVSGTSTSNGQAGTWTDTGNAIADTVPAGSSVTVAETLGGDNLGSYTSSLSCPGVQPDDGTFTAPPTAITCTFTNTAAQHTVTLQKEWIDGIAGDVTHYSIQQGDNGATLGSSTSGGQPGSWIDTGAAITQAVSDGATVTLTETLDPGNAGDYTPSLSCTGGVDPTDGVFTMPSDDITCTYSNANEKHMVTLQKNWVASIDGDSTLLQINGANDTTSTTSGGDFNDRENVSTASVVVGSPVTVSEQLGQSNAGQYAPSLSCVGATPDANGGFTMPDEDVTCTITNTLKTATLTLQKTVVNDNGGTATPSDWTLTATGSNKTVTGTPTDDPNNPNPDITNVTVPIGDYRLSESGTAAGYDWTNVTCVTSDNQTLIDVDDPSGTPVLTLADGENVTCTYTNNDTPASWTVSKTADPPSGSTVMPGDTITYSVTLTNTGGSMPASIVVTDDLSDVLNNASIGTITAPDGSTANVSGDTLTWTVADFTGPSEVLTYEVTVKADAWGVTLSNHVTPPTGGTCVGDNDCTTTHYTPAWKLTKTSDPADGSTVMPGSTITYTLHALNTSQGIVSGATATDDLSDVLDDATLNMPLPPSLTQSGDALTWTIPTLNPGDPEATVSFSVTVNSDAYDATLTNLVTPGGGGGKCPVGTEPDCTTTHHTPGKPKLTLVKTVVNDNGGTATAADWTLTADGSGSGGSTISGKTGDPSVTDATVLPGTYDLSEQAADGIYGYSLTYLTCLNGGQPLDTSPTNPTVELTAGMNVTCEFTNDDSPAALTVSKTSDPPSGSTVQPGTNIKYQIDLALTGGTPSYPIVVTDDLSDVLNNASIGSISWPIGSSAELNGTTLTWTITSLASTTEHLNYYVKVNSDAWGKTLTNAVTPPTGGTCAGDNDCTTTHYTPAWTLTKTSDPADGSTVMPGSTITYTLHALNTSQGIVSGATATDDLSDVLNHASLNTPLPPSLVQSGDELTWTIPTLNPGDPEATVSFSVTVNSDAYDATLTNVVTPGGGGGECPVGVEPDCTTTHHTPPMPKLTLEKTVVNGHGGTSTPSDWTLTATGPDTTISGNPTNEAPPNPAITDVPVPAGTYDLSEVGTPGYDLTGLVCVNGEQTLGTSPTDPSVDLVAGMDVTCTYTNTDTPALLTLQKIVDNNETNAGKVPADWTLTATPQNIDGQGTVSGNGDPDSDGGVKDVSVFSGQYKLSESGPAGFDAGDWECAGGVVDGDIVTVPSGGDVLCHITNTAQFPHLTLIKQVDNGDTGGTATDQDWTLTADGTESGGSHISGKTGDETITDAAVKVGTYVLSESTGPVGYTAGDWICDGGTQEGATVALTAGASATCIIVNTAQPPEWNVWKTSDPVSGSSVEVGSEITYTVHAAHVAGIIPANTVITDDLSKVLDHATMVGDPDPSTGTATVSGDTLTWNTGAFDGTATVTYTVKVDEDAFGVTLKNVVTPPEGGECVAPDETPELMPEAIALDATGDDGSTAEDPCSTTHHVIDVDMSILKSHAPISGGSVTPGSNDTIDYTLAITNKGEDAATTVSVTDTLPVGLSYVDGTLKAPAGWTASFTGSTLTATFAGPFDAGDSVAITFRVLVGSVQPPKVENTACVASAQTDANPANDCSTDTTPVVKKGGGLPPTGSDVVGLLGAGGVLVMLGILVLFLVWRRRHDGQFE